jgi:hypothetical protein
MKKPQKEQFNTRLSGDLKRAMRIMSAVMDTSTEELTEVLLAASLGSRDPKIRAKQELVLLLAGIQKAHREAQTENAKRFDQIIYIMSKYDRRDNLKSSDQ